MTKIYSPAARAKLGARRTCSLKTTRRRTACSHRRPSHAAPKIRMLRQRPRRRGLSSRFPQRNSWRRHLRWSQATFLPSAVHAAADSVHAQTLGWWML